MERNTFRGGTLTRMKRATDEYHALAGQLGISKTDADSILKKHMDIAARSVILDTMDAIFHASMELKTKGTSEMYGTKKS